MKLHTVNVDQQIDIEDEVAPEVKVRSNVNGVQEDDSDSLADEQSIAKKLFDEGLAHKEKGELPAAIRSFKAALKYDAEMGWAHHCLAQSLSWSGDHVQAIDHYLLAAGLLANADRAISMCQLAELHALDGNLSKAWQVLQIAELSDSSITGWTDHVSALRLLAERITWAFDPAWYREQAKMRNLTRAGQEPGMAVALHYLRNGHMQGLVSHWIVDIEYVATQLPNSTDNDVPLVLRLVEALEQGYAVSPCWLVDLSYLMTQDADRSALQHLQSLAEVGFRCDEPTALLFDPQYYRSQFGYEITSPIQHYMTIGCLDLVDPHPAFRSAWYASQVGLDKNCDAVRHYLVEKGCLEHSPNPVLVLDHYLDRFPDLDPGHVPPLNHFLMLSEREGTIPRFDREYYLKSCPDIFEAGMCPERHFLEYGSREPNRAPFRGFSAACIRSRHRAPDHFHPAESGTYYAKGDFHRNTVLVVSHSASRTGAPLIALRIVQELARIESLEVLVVVFGDGPLVTEFAGSAHVIRTVNAWGADPDENSDIIDSFSGRRPSVTFCNSSESRHFARSLHAADLPVVSLIHEIADHYDSAGTWAEIFELSERVVFPSEFVRQRSDLKIAGYLSAAEAEATVLPQGLLTHNFARFGRATSRERARSDLGIGEQDVLVLGCGTIDLRKGIDLFLQCARRIVTNDEYSRISFLWLGGKQPQSDNENPVYWALKNLDDAQRSRIRFIGTTDDVEPWFQGADIFLLSSRSDPYPCVMHEALAAQLPIVYMLDSGGSAELVGDRFGIGVPYEDVEGMTQSIVDLSFDTEKRNQLAAAGERYVRASASFVSYVDELIGIAVEATVKSSNPVIDQRTSPMAGLKVPPRRESKVYFLNPDWGISGINSLTETLVRQLNARGMDTCLLFTRGRGSEFNDDGDFLPDLPIEFLDVDTQAEFPGNVHNAMMQYFQRHDPCVLVTNYDYTASALSAKLPDHIGVVGVVQSDDSEHYEHTNRLGHYWNRIITVSKRISERVIEMNPSFESRLVCIPNGVPPALTVEQLQSDKRDLRNSVRIIYTGRIVRAQKRVERYGELVRILEARGVDYVFDFVGEGDARSALEHALAPQVRSGRVRFHGRCSPSETQSLLSSADVFALFSDFEGMPLSLLEAAGAGCIPVVYSMESGLNDFIKNDVNGFVCQSRTVLEAADVIERLQSGETRSPMRVAARRLLDEYALTADAATDGYLNVFNQVLAECERETLVRPRWIHDSSVSLASISQG